LNVPHPAQNIKGLNVPHPAQNIRGLNVPAHEKKSDIEHKRDTLNSPQLKSLLKEPKKLIDVKAKKIIELNMNHNPNIESPVIPKVKTQVEIRDAITNEYLVPIGGKCFNAETGEKRECVAGAVCTTEIPDYNSICVARH